MTWQFQYMLKVKKTKIKNNILNNYIPIEMAEFKNTIVTIIICSKVHYDPCLFKMYHYW